MNVDLVLTNGLVVSPDSTVKASIAAKDGKIVAIGPQEIMPEARKTIDVQGRHIIPGLVDTHVHCEWPDWDFATGCTATAKAAAAAGVTTCLQYLSGPGRLTDILQDRIRLWESHSCVDAGFHMAVFTDGQVDDIRPVAEMGASSFKFFIPYRGTEVVPPLMDIDDGIIFRGFQEIAKLPKPARANIHCENIEIFFHLKSKVLADGRGDSASWDEVRPWYVEVESMKRVAFFSEVTGCPLYWVHMSTAEGVDFLRECRGKGIDVYGETCPQYLTLTDTDVDRRLGKVNPPLRADKRHHARLWEGLNSGILSTVGTDHAPCATKHKQEFWEAVVGMAGIQTGLPVLLSEGVNKGRMTMEKLVEVTSYNAANIFGLPHKGRLAVGADADMVVVDLDKKFTVRAAELHHISDFSPFEGRELTGMPVMTFVRGVQVMQDGEIVGPMDHGRFQPRPAA